jgi:fumarate hydratase class II
VRWQFPAKQRLQRERQWAFLALFSILRHLSSGMTKTRTESDTFGPIEVPANRLWGAQTERSRRNFRIGEERMPTPIIRALGLIKHAAAEVNHRLGSLDKKRAQAIARAVHEVMEGK